LFVTRRANSDCHLHGRRGVAAPPFLDKIERAPGSLFQSRHKRGLAGTVSWQSSPGRGELANL
jgi:hypothetical protein